MQGITEHGINDWKELSNWVLPELTKFELKVSYRQTPTLVNLAREMYKDEVGHYPSYNSDKEMDGDNEPAPMPRESSKSIKHTIAKCRLWQSS